MSYTKVIARLKLLLTRGRECGQSLVEYGLIVSLIAIAALAGLGLLAGDVTTFWGWIGSEITTAVDAQLS